MPPDEFPIGLVGVGVEPTRGHGKYGSAKVVKRGTRFLLMVVVVVVVAVAVAVATV